MALFTIGIIPKEDNISIDLKKINNISSIRQKIDFKIIKKFFEIRYLHQNTEGKNHEIDLTDKNLSRNPELTEKWVLGKLIHFMPNNDFSKFRIKCISACSVLKNHQICQNFGKKIKKSLKMDNSSKLEVFTRLRSLKDNF